MKRCCLVAVVVTVGLALPVAALAKPSIKPGQYSVTASVEVQGGVTQPPLEKRDDCITTRSIADTESVLTNIAGIKQLKEPGFEIKNLKQSDNHLSFDLVWDRGERGKAKGAGEASFRGDAYEGWVKMEISLPGGKQRVSTVRYSAKRTGDCTK